MACNRGVTFKGTQVITIAAIRQFIYNYHFLLVACC